MATTSIEWATDVWNPVSGCTRVSAGCDHCYAVKMTHRLENMGQQEKYGGLTVLNNRGDRHFNGVVKCHENALSIPLKWKKPRKVFVNSMSDLFHKDVPFDFIDKVFAVMALCPQHTFQILTKRPERMAEYLAYNASGCSMRPCLILRAAYRIAVDDRRVAGTYSDLHRKYHADYARSGCWPLPGVWLGTSVENQQAADERIPHLLRCPAAVRFLSVEPLLGPVDLTRYIRQTLISWTIVGGESGKGARPMHPQWARSIRDQCVAAGVPFFFKQWGNWLPWRWQGEMTRPGDLFVDPDGTYVRIKHGGAIPASLAPERQAMRNVGKKAAGRLLDGREWNEFPPTPQFMA